MEFSKETRITLIIVAGVVILGLAALAVISGAEIDTAGILEKVFTGIAGLLAGLSIAGGGVSR